MNILSAFGKNGTLLSIAVLILLEARETVVYLECDDEGFIIDQKKVRVSMDHLTPQQEKLIADQEVNTEYMVSDRGSVLHCTFSDGSRIVIDLSAFVSDCPTKSMFEEAMEKMLKDMHPTL